MRQSRLGFIFSLLGIIALAAPVLAQESPKGLPDNLPTFQTPGQCCLLPEQAYPLSEALKTEILSAGEWVTEPLFSDPEMSAFDGVSLLYQTAQSIGLIVRKQEMWNGFEMDLYELVTVNLKTQNIKRMEIAGRLVTASLSDGSATYHTLQSQLMANQTLTVTHKQDYQPGGLSIEAGAKPEISSQTQRWKWHPESGEISVLKTVP